MRIVERSFPLYAPDNNNIIFKIDSYNNCYWNKSW